MRYEDLDPNEIITVNAIMSPELFQKLQESMRREGWRGRPLLVEELIRSVGPEEPEYHAWTGSHRIEAARAVGLGKVPCLILEMAEADIAFVAVGYDLFRNSFATWRECVEDSRLDISRLEALRKAGLTAAADLMESELERS